MVLQMDMFKKHVKKRNFEFKGDEDFRVIFCRRHVCIFEIICSYRGEGRRNYSGWGMPVFMGMEKVRTLPEV